MNFSKTLLFSLCAAASTNLLANNNETAETTAMPAPQTIDLKQIAIKGYWKSLEEDMPSFEKCKTVIEPFFDQAERELETIKYCMNHANDELAQKYFLTLFCRYAPLEFIHQHERPTEYAKEVLFKDTGELFKMLKEMQAIKEKENVLLDIDKEWRNTTNVILQLNTAFYNNVSPRKKLLLDMAKNIPGVIRATLLDEDLDEYLQKCKNLPKRDIAVAKDLIKLAITGTQECIQRCIDFKARWDQAEVQDDDQDEDPSLKPENIQYMAFLYAELEHDQHFLNALNEQFPTDGEAGLFIRGEESDEDSDGETNQN